MKKRHGWFAVLIVPLIVSVVHANTISRRGITVTYDYNQISDGFGNIRKILVTGMIKNTTEQTAAQVKLQLKFLWETRSSISKKLYFKNISPGHFKEFRVEVDLGSHPDMLRRIVARLSKIKFSTTRAPSKPTIHNIVSTERYSLTRLNEEGRAFLKILDALKSKHPFKVPLKDEFETSDEYETRVNYAENEHFTMLMDMLEKTYGEALGGKGATIRFLPEIIQKELVYLSEYSAVFHVHLRLGRYNADKRQFEDVNLEPRTFSFKPKTILPKADIEIIHKSGFFFLRKPIIKVSRKEGRQWRKVEADLVLELKLRFGVVQDGPYFESRCVVDSITLKNAATDDIYRHWEFPSLSGKPAQ